MLRAFALPLLSALAIAANGSRVIAANGSSVIPANTSVNATPGPAHATAPNAALENLTSFGWTNHGIVCSTLPARDVDFLASVHMIAFLIHLS